MSHVTRNPLARSDVTIDNCEAIQFTFDSDDLRTIIVWRDKPRLTRPADPSKRLSHVTADQHRLALTNDFHHSPKQIRFTLGQHVH